MSYTLCIRTDSEPTKLLYHPKQKPGREGGLIQIKTCRQIPLQVNFKFSGFGVLKAIWSMFLVLNKTFDIISKSRN
jgi:hypothetical protein